jgi:B9 domain-containing protein 2
VHVPSAPGLHELSVPLWRPLGTPAQELAAFFLGGPDQLLTSTSVLFSAASERYRLVTVPSGTVHVRVEVLQRFVEVEAGM